MNLRHVVLLLIVLVVLGGAFVAVRQLGSAEEKRRQTLLPQVRTAFDALRSDLSANHGIELVLVSAGRSKEEQAAKVAAGLSLTNESWHTIGRAVDVQTAKVDPKTKKIIADASAKDIASYQKLHEVAKRYGFRGIPNGSPFKSDGSKALLSNGVWDVYHLEFPEGFKNVAAALQAGGTRVA